MLKTSPFQPGPIYESIGFAWLEGQETTACRTHVTPLGTNASGTCMT